MIPKLRFQEFKGNYSHNSFKDYVVINQGLQIAISDRLNSPIDGAYFYITNEFLRSNSLKSYWVNNPPKNSICSFEDILMTRTGNTGIVVTDVQGVFHNNFFKIKYPNDLFNKVWLVEYLRRYEIQKQILRYAGTSTIPDLNHKDFYRLPLLHPSIEEQTKIANLLSILNSKINLLTKKKEALETYKKGLMQKIFSQELRFKREDGTDYPEWERVTLNDIVRSNIRYGIVQPGDFTVDGMILIRGVDYMKGWNDIGNFFRVSESIEFKYRKARVKNGDLLISIVGTPGKAVIVPDYIKEANITQTTARVPLSDDQSEIFYQEQINDYRIQKEISKLIKGAAQPGINVEDVKKLKVFQPSYEEQKRLEKMFDTLIQRIISIEKQMNLSKELKKGLLQQMFV